MLFRKTRCTITVLLASGTTRHGVRIRTWTPADSGDNNRHCPTPRPAATNTAQSPSRRLPSRSIVVVQGRVTMELASMSAALSSSTMPPGSASTTRNMPPSRSPTWNRYCSLVFPSMPGTLECDPTFSLRLFAM